MADCRVIASHDRSYAAPISGAAGDAVKIGRQDDEAPGWVWCEHAGSGLEGWVPESFIERGEGQTGVLRRDYSAMELSVFAGQTVKTFETVAGWTWCAATSGDAGWVPTHKLEMSC
jgi:hypothetical protein